MHSSSSEAYNLSRSSRAALQHLFALIHFWPANSLNVHSFDNSCSLSPNSSFVEARMWRHLSSIVNPITQSTSHRSSATRFRCHLVAKGPERHGGTVGPFDSRSLAVFGSSSNGFRLSKTQHGSHSKPPDLRSQGPFCSFDLQHERASHVRLNTFIYCDSSEVTRKHSHRCQFQVS